MERQTQQTFEQRNKDTKPQRRYVRFLLIELDYIWTELLDTFFVEFFKLWLRNIFELKPDVHCLI